METGSTLSALDFCNLLYAEKEQESSVKLVTNYVSNQIDIENFEQLDEVLKIVNLDNVNPNACIALLRSTFCIRKHLSEWGGLLNRLHKSFNRRGFSISLIRGILID